MSGKKRLTSKKDDILSRRFRFCIFRAFRRRDLRVVGDSYTRRVTKYMKIIIKSSIKKKKIKKSEGKKRNKLKKKKKKKKKSRNREKGDTA